MNITEMNRTEWLASFRARWRQGEHVALIGPTGSGKTGLASDLLSIRAYVVAFAVKSHDDTLSMFSGYKRIKRWPPEYGQQHVILWVKPESLTDIITQREKIMFAMERVYKAGGWCAYFDDLSYMVDVLRIRTPVVMFLSQGRSSFISAVCAATRPRRVPVEAFNQCRWVISFHYDDKEELKRVAEISGLDNKTMLELNGQLALHPQGHSDFLVMGKREIVIVRNKR